MLGHPITPPLRNKAYRHFLTHEHMPTKQSDAPPRFSADLEGLVWACAFAKGLTLNPDEDALHADETVQRLKSLVKHASPTRAPEMAAARANVIINRQEFDIWYRVQVQVVFGRCADFHIPNKRECAQAFERYRAEIDSVD